MKRIKFMLYPLALIVLVFSLVGSVFAQDESVYCYDLTEEDCTLYTDLQTNSEMPESTAFNVDVSGSIAAADEQIPFAVNVSGAYVTDTAAVDTAVETFGAITLRDVSLGSVITLLDDIVSAWDAKLSIDLSGTPEAAMLTNGTPIDLYLVDGVAYINSPLLAMMMNDPTIEGVYGIDLFEVIDFGLSSVTMADLMELGEGLAMNMDDMSSDAFMGMFEESFMNSFNQSLGQADAFAEEDFAGAVNLVRLADEDGDGENLYVFETTIDLSAMFAIPALRDQIATMLEQQIDPEEMMGIDAETLLDALSASFQGSTMVITEKYGATSNVMVGADMAMNFTIDTGELAALSGEPMGEPEQITMNFDVNYMLENINQVDSIDLPADAQIVPFMDLIGGM